MPVLGMGVGIPSDGQITNGVAHFVRPTVPVARVGGSALVAGDRWYKTDDYSQWVYNGTLWLSQTPVFSYASATLSGNGSIATGNTSFIDFSKSGSSYQFFIERFTYRYSLATADVSNYWTLDMRAGIHGASSFASSVLTGIAATNLTTPQASAVEVSVNPNLLVSFNTSPTSISLFGTRVGTPANLLISAVILIRRVFN